MSFSCCSCLYHQRLFIALSVVGVLFVLRHESWTCKLIGCLGIVGVFKLLRRLWRALICRPAVSLHYDRDCDQIKSLIPKLKALKRGHAAAPFIPTRLLQTAMAERFPPGRPNFQRETIHIVEFKKTSATHPRQRKCCPAVVPADDVSIDWLPPSSGNPAAPICILVPGLTGSSESIYIQRTALDLVKHDIRVACFNPRSRGGNKLNKPFLYSAGYTEDLRHVIYEVIKKGYPEAPLLAIGFSLGSSYVANFVEEEGEKCPLIGAMSLACPIDLLSCSNRFQESLFGWALDKYLVRACKEVMDELEHLRSEFEGTGIDWEQAKSAKNMYEFDSAFVARMFGFRCASDYYRKIAVGNDLGSIRRPMLFLSASNDPIAPADKVRRDDFEIRNPHHEAVPILLAVTEEGAHSMVWPEGITGKGSWAIDVIREFVQAIVPSPKVSAASPLLIEEGTTEQ